MAIVVVGTVGVPACYGGFETLVENLLDQKEADIIVYCSGRAYSKRLNFYKGARLYYLPLKANGVQSILYDILSILHAVLKGHKDLLVLGVSGAIIFPFVRFLIPKSKIVTNIDGLEWQRNKWGRWAKRFLKLSEKVAVKYSDIVVADNQAIADYLVSEYQSESEVIPYGGDQPYFESESVVKENYALGLCRIEPENNVDMILEAFKIAGKRLKFIGNWKNSEFGRSLLSEYSKVENIELIDPVYESRSLFAHRAKCLFYVHGHSAGGTNPSLVEMMHFGVPVFAFDCAYNRATMEGRGKYFGSVASLVSLIDGRLDLADGQDMLEIAKRRYTWKVVRQRYLSLFDQQ